MVAAPWETLYPGTHYVTSGVSRPRVPAAWAVPRLLGVLGAAVVAGSRGAQPVGSGARSRRR